MSTSNQSMTLPEAIELVSQVVLREAKRLSSNASYHLDQLNEPDYDHRAKADLLVTESNKLCQAMQTILKEI